MTQGLGIRALLACLVSLAVSPVSHVFAQAAAPGPGTPAFPASDGGSVVGPMIVLVLVLIAALVLTVFLADLRRKRRAQAIAIEGQISDALMREPRLSGSVLTAVAQVPLGGRPPTVEIRGQVEYPDLRDVAVRIVRQELLRHHPEGSVEDRIFVSPPIPADRR
jgi:hypothetical protein